MYRNALATLVVSLLLLPVCGRAAEAADLNAVLQEISARYDLPGAVLLVSGPGGSETVSTGIANLATRTPVTGKTRFHVASVGKIVTATTVLRLVDEGKLSLDMKVSAFLDDRDVARIAHADTATIGQALSHTSGLPDCLRNQSFSIPEHPNIAWTSAEVLRLGRCRAPTKPGVYSYSNTNYIMLGHILEKIEGQDLAAVLSSHILQPLDMADSAIAVDPADPLLAHGYRTAAPGAERADASLLAWSSRLGDAPLSTTAGDLERLFKDLFRPAGRTLSPAMRAAMVTEHGKDEDEAYGLGLELVPTDFGIRYGHNGRFAGFCAEAWYYPEKDTIVILLGNGDEKSKEDVMDFIEPRLFPTPGNG